MSRGCGAAKMEPAAAGPGPLIVNNKQPQPPPPPPPTTAQPPPGAPRAAAGLLPGGKAREFNRNQRKDSEVRAAGGRGCPWAGGRGGRGARAASGPSRASGWLDRRARGGGGGCHFTEDRAAGDTGSPEPCHELLCGPGEGPGDSRSAPGGAARGTAPGYRVGGLREFSAPHHFRPLILAGRWATPVVSEGTQESFVGA